MPTQELNRKVVNPDGTTSYVSGTSEGVSSAITSASLTSTTPIDLTQKPQPSSPYTSLLGGGNSIIGTNDVSLTDAPVDVKKEKPSDLMAQIQGLLAPPPKSQGDLSLAQSKVSSGEQEATAALQAERNARDKYNALNAQLQQFQYNASTLIPTALQEQSTGRGITSAGLAPIQAAELRKNALAAAPIQFNALIAQAELANAQGRTALAQGVLQQANDHLDKMVELQNADIQAQYNYQKDIFNKVWEYANESEKRTLDTLAQKKEQEFTLQRDKVNNDYATQKMLLQQQIDASDPLKQLQIQKAQRDLAGGGKPLTSTQSLALGYGERLLQSSLVIDEVGSQFTGFMSRFVGAVPAGLRTQDRQRFEQAKRNFINAVLRRESGAAIAPSEFESADLQYFPQPGDKEDVLIQKKQNRDLVIKNFLREGGVDTTPQDSSLSDPLGIGLGDVFSNPLNI